MVVCAPQHISATLFTIFLASLAFVITTAETDLLEVPPQVDNDAIVSEFVPKSSPASDVSSDSAQGSVVPVELKEGQLVEVPNAGSMLQLKAVAHAKMTSGTTGSPENGLKTWSSSDDQTGKGSWANFWAGDIDAAAPKEGPKKAGRFDSSKWCAASGAGKCKGDWSEVALDSTMVIKGVTIQGWGKSCVSKFTVSVSSDGKSFKPVDKGATFDGLNACSTTKDNDAKTNVVFNTAAEAKHVRISVKGGTGSCCLRWSALALTGKGLEAWKRMQASLVPIVPSWVYKGPAHVKCNGNGIPAFRIDKHCGRDRVGLLLSQSKTWHKTFKYTCPNGWYWPKAAKYFALLRSYGCYGNNLFSQKGGYAMVSRCPGMSPRSYYLVGDNARGKAYIFRFADSKSNANFQHGGTYMGQKSADWRTSDFGGIACIKNGF